MLKLYHTYKKKLLPFKPVRKGKVGMYTCGPTVYNDMTIGNINTYLFNDFLRRSLEYLGYKVKHVMNITDVGHLTMTEAKKELAQIEGKKIEITDDEEGIDRMEKAAKREGISVWDVAEKYIIQIFGKNWNKADKLDEKSDLGKLNIEKPTVICRATDYIKEQIDLIKKLENKGYTYVTKDAVYFDIQKFPKFQDLVGQKFDKMKSGERADTSDPERKHPGDFRLWQLNQPNHVMLWDSPWGKGYPGWHIECSAMSLKHLGQPFDIHTSGEDHIKIHHPNEIAQSESAYGKTMSNYWLHNKFIRIDGKRMGKSLGNAYTIGDLEDKSFDALDFKYFSLLSHYRSTKNFTWEALKSARNARLTLINSLKKIKSTKGKILKKIQKEFIDSLKDDINMPKAISIAWKVLKSKEKDEDKFATIIDFDKVFGLRLKKHVNKKDEISKEMIKEIEQLIGQRNEAREQKDYKRADEIRKKLKEDLSVRLIDSGEKTDWEKI